MDLQEYETFITNNKGEIFIATETSIIEGDVHVIIKFIHTLPNVKDKRGFILGTLLYFLSTYGDTETVEKLLTVHNKMSAYILTTYIQDGMLKILKKRNCYPVTIELYINKGGIEGVVGHGTPGNSNSVKEDDIKEFVTYVVYSAYLTMEEGKSV
jgi:hypothetical protein